MPIKIFTHKVQSGKVEPVQWMAYATGQVFLTGAILTFNAGEVVEGGANPTEIVGVALQPAGSGPGFDAGNSPTVITGRSQKVSVSRPNDSVIYAATLTNASAVTVVPAQADVGVQYGLTAYAGVWTVDKGNANDRVEVVGFDTTVYGGVVFFKFLNAHLSHD